MDDLGEIRVVDVGEGTLAMGDSSAADKSRSRSRSDERLNELSSNRPEEPGEQ